MSTLPEASSFFACLNTTAAKKDIAGWFGTQGWLVRKVGFDDFELRCSWAELVLEGESPKLLHGLVADIVSNSVVILSVLDAHHVVDYGECEDEDHQMISAFSSLN